MAKLDYLDIIKKIGAIPKSKLEDGSYYIGVCRNSRVAIWDSKEERFYYLRRKFGKIFSEPICHPEDDDGYDLFIPYKKIEVDLENSNTASIIFPNKT